MLVSDRRLPPKNISKQRRVLILVLVDVGLGRCQGKGELQRLGGVLILVLVDVGLGLLNFILFRH